MKFKNFKALNILLFVPSICITIFFTSCNKNEKEPPSCLYTGNDMGTDWKGYIRGSLTLEFNNHNYTCSIKTNDGYEAKDLYIPQKVEHNKNIYDLTQIDDSAFSFYCHGYEDEANELLQGSLHLPYSINLEGWCFACCTKLTSVDLNNCIINDTGNFTCCLHLTEINIGRYSEAPNWPGHGVKSIGADVWQNFNYVCAYGDVKAKGAWGEIKTNVIPYLEFDGLPPAWTLNGQ